MFEFLRFTTFKLSIHSFFFIRGLCTFAARTLCSLTLRDLYGNGNLLLDLGLRREVPFGSRMERGIPSIETLLEDPCCFYNCSALIGIMGLHRQWNLYAACQSRQEQDLFILEVGLWSVSMGRPTAWCNHHLQRLFDVSADRLAKLRAISARAEGEICSDLFEPHGNKGRQPKNKTPAEILLILKRILELNTRTDPEKGILDVMRSDKLGGAATLVGKLRDGTEAAKFGIHDTTLGRFIKKHLKKIGCSRLCVHDPGHNACKECQDAELLIDELVKSLTHLKHAVEDEVITQDGVIPIEPTSEKRLATLREQVLEATQRLKETKSATFQHLETHLEIADYVARITGLAQALHARFEFSLYSVYFPLKMTPNLT